MLTEIMLLGSIYFFILAYLSKSDFLKSVFLGLTFFMLGESILIGDLKLIQIKHDTTNNIDYYSYDFIQNTNENYINLANIFLWLGAIIIIIGLVNESLRFLIGKKIFEW
jgi:hypothetical protein